MNKQKDKQLDQLAKKIMKDTPLESPSINFTDMVMSRVEAVEVSSVTTYRPLIPKGGWVIIVSILCGLITYAALGYNMESLGWLNNINLKVFPNLELSNPLSGLVIPKIVTYAVVLFGFMLSIQIFFLKRHLSKPFEV